MINNYRNAIIMDRTSGVYQLNSNLHYYLHSDETIDNQWWLIQQVKEYVSK